jgi:hypothetical protein
MRLRASTPSWTRSARKALIRRTPMRGHGLMQAIARVNRVFKDTLARRWRHAPAHQHHLSVGTRVANHRIRIVREHPPHRRRVTNIAVDHAEEGHDRCLIGGDVELAHWLALRNVQLVSSNLSNSINCDQVVSNPPVFLVQINPLKLIL